MLASAIVLAGAACCHFVFRRPAFDADKVGMTEARMWRAYYGGSRTQLGLLLVKLLRSQYGMSVSEARQTAESFAGAAMAFHSIRGDYDAKVLPELTQAYRVIQGVSGLPFDPAAAARAELGWWVARRTRGENSPEQVGRRIGELYALLYGESRPELQRAGLLRAQAAALRDHGGRNADWPRIEQLLCESYREVAKVTRSPLGGMSRSESVEGR